MYRIVVLVSRDGYRGVAKCIVAALDTLPLTAQKSFLRICSSPAKNQNKQHKYVSLMEDVATCL